MRDARGGFSCRFGRWLYAFFAGIDGSFEPCHRTDFDSIPNADNSSCDLIHLKSGVFCILLCYVLSWLWVEGADPLLHATASFRRYT